MTSLSASALRRLSAAVLDYEDFDADLPERFAAELARAQQGSQARLGRYFLLAEVGRGSGGCVYRAYDPVLHRLAAVKRIATAGLEEQTIRRLEQECVAMAAVTHPGVVAVYDAGIEGDELFFAMEWMVDGNLEEAHRHAPFTRRAVVRLICSLAESLAAIHAAGILHLDIKPANILLAGGQAKIGDFGAMERLMSAASSGRHEVGTVGFMAPEQAQGRRSEIDHRTDIFGLGATLKVLLSSASDCGRPLDAALAGIADKATAVDPAARFASMTAFADDLKAWAATDSKVISPRRGQMFAALLLLVVAGAAWSSRQSLIEPSPHQGAQVLASFSFHPAAWEQPVTWLEEEHSAAAGAARNQLAAPLKELPVELAILKLLQQLVIGEAEDLGTRIHSLHTAFPDRAEPWLLLMSHSLHFERTKSVRTLCAQMPLTQLHSAFPGIFALATFATDGAQAALPLLQKAAAKDSILLADVGVALLLLERPAEAELVLDQCRKLHPTLATAHHHAAVAKLRLGKPQAAVLLLLDWNEMVNATLDLEWDFAPSLDFTALSRSSAVYIWPSKELLARDPWLAALWEESEDGKLLLQYYQD